MTEESPRQAGYAAVTKVIARAGRDAWTNALIWKCVEVFGDAMGVPSGSTSTHKRSEEQK